MTEDQDMEYKRLWKDEYLKTVCGYANSEGGVLRIGVEDDGTPAGVGDPEKTAKTISDTIVNILNIYPTVRIEQDSTVTITVKQSEEPVLLRGKAYRRVGNTNVEVKGRELLGLLMRRLNTSWTDEVMTEEPIESLDRHVIQTFRDMGRRKGRLTEEEMGLSDRDLLDKLGLVRGGTPTRAAVLLFHPFPQKYFQGARVKIGLFEGSEMLFDDLVEGPVLLMPEKIVDLIMTKYTIASITYDGIYRREAEPYPRPAVREAVLNAIVHNEYAIPTAIQIKMSKNEMTIYNSGHLMDGWTVEKLLSAHTSEPRNPAVANVFFRAGAIEAFGRGISTIMSQYRDAGNRMPVFKDDPTGFSVTLTSMAGTAKASNEDKTGIWEDYTGDVLAVLSEGPMAASEIMAAVSYSKTRSTFYRAVLNPMKDKGLIVPTDSDSPRSPSQRYRLSNER
ncbi:MAG: putative DNA binding domain-containing protein [Candidatus Methanoplasma sp.]|jgi:ATP-dependent DNA helicase RecG|nr:putative DNA binding domain-containing protein [Candidatus Methanoplasma sp.]